MIMLSSLLSFERLSKNPVDENKKSQFSFTDDVHWCRNAAPKMLHICLFPCGFILGSWHSSIKKHVGKKSALSI
jgi:hypothetical protein